MPLVADVSRVFRVHSANTFPMFLHISAVSKIRQKPANKLFRQSGRGVLDAASFFQRQHSSLKKLDGNPPSVSIQEVGTEDFVCVTSSAIRQPDHGGKWGSGSVAVSISVHACVFVCVCVW